MKMEMESVDCLPWPLASILSFITWLIWPCQGAVSGLFSVFLPTSIEKCHPLQLLAKRLTLIPIYSVLILIFLPLAVCCIPVRCFFCLFRKPYQYSVVKNIYTQAEEDHILLKVSEWKLQTYDFGIATANVCLLPEFLSRINNLSDASFRAKSIGKRIVVDNFFYSGVHMSPSRSFTQDNPHADGQLNGKKSLLVGGLATHFPQLDFLCLQEVFDWNYNKLLRRELHKVFPYIVHDVGVTSLKSNYFLFNSGLMFASQHPVLQADFKFFSHSLSQCQFCSKGLLMLKVLIGKKSKEKRNVGYIFVTHLQAYQGTEAIIYCQLDEIFLWTKEFKKQTTQTGDVLMFDILCGDFNFDNISPGDKESREHPLLDEYDDPCRIKPGSDYEWTVGTEFKQIFMHEKSARTPESLKAALNDPVLRHRYLVDADVVEQSRKSLVDVRLHTDEHGNVQSFPAGGKRRIDYILHKKEAPINVSSVKFVTRFASLTDHIPVSMTFRVPKKD